MLLFCLIWIQIKRLKKIINSSYNNKKYYKKLQRKKNLRNIYLFKTCIKNANTFYYLQSLLTLAHSSTWSLVSSIIQSFSYLFAYLELLIYPSISNFCLFYFHLLHRSVYNFICFLTLRYWIFRGFILIEFNLIFASKHSESAQVYSY